MSGYTFRNPKPKRKSNLDIQTNVDENYTEDAPSYQKYTFWLMLLIFFMTLVGGGYIYFRGLPVKVRA